jgi:general secretion pathway protein F
MARFSVETSSTRGSGPERLSVEAATPTDAARQVMAQGRFPISVRVERVGWAARLDQSLWTNDRLGLAELALFAEQLADLVRAGVTIEQALDLLAPDGQGPGLSAARERDRRDRALGRLAQRLLRRVREGASLSAALRQEPAVPSSFAGVIQGAEGAGALAVGLASLAVALQRQSETRDRIRAALAYPAMVLVVALLAVCFVLTAVIPEFAPLFAGEERRLPMITRGVLWLSALLTGRLLWVGLVLLLVGLLGRVVWRQAPGLRQRVWQLALRMAPVRYALRLDLAQATRVMGALLESGMEASQAMQLAGEAASFDQNRQGFAQGARRLREGESLSRVYAALPLMPDAAASLLAVGERAGQAGLAASRAAQLLETDTNRRVNRLLAILNPAAVITLGALVALFIAAIMLGILSINQLVLR